MPNPNNLTHDWRDWLRTALYTTLLCAAIAVITQRMFGHNYWLNLWISLGYGQSIVWSLALLAIWKPHWPDWISNLMALLMGVSLGMANLMVALAVQGELGHVVGDARAMVSNLGIGLFFGSIGLLFFYALYRLQALRAEVSERRRQEAENARALTLSQLKVMQSQMEPHFLFNTLANVQALIDEEPARARDMLQALTTMLRANLKRVRADVTTLGDELAIAQSYLDIQSIRMCERLTCQIDIPETLRSVPLPPLLLQPLIENAIRHGIEPKPEGGTIKLWSEVLESNDGSGEQLRLHVSDDGLGMEASADTQGEGVGLSNVRQRLGQLYGQSAHLRMQAGTRGGLDVILTIPLEQHSTTDRQEVNR